VIRPRGGHGCPHKPVPQPGLARESNFAILLLPGIKDFAELQPSKPGFLQAAPEFERVVEFLAVFTLGIEPRNEVVATLLCSSLRAA
ncbi:MAG TPA: hypothetical protein VHP35_10110, partial [Terriglobia bacterium]|nr:hypothetical protein [Terriglobia bacterium]